MLVVYELALMALADRVPAQKIELVVLVDFTSRVSGEA
jgi:hypothetical protein